MPLSTAQCSDLFAWASPRLGLRAAGFRRVRKQVCKRIARRMKELGVATASDYRARLERSPEEWPHLDAACQVTITRFYRDRPVFDCLRELLVPLARNAVREGRPLRIWSAGACSGEEPYTVALLLRFDVAERVAGLTWDILATDANPVVLARARAGRYPRGALRELPSDWQKQAFELLGNEVQLRPDVVRGVRLEQQDLREQWPEGPFDVVLCRNVIFTYFDEQRQRDSVPKLASVIAPGGLLVIGKREELPGTELFRQLGAVPIFQRAR